MVNEKVYYGLFLFILFLITVYIHLYMHIRSREEIPFSEPTTEDRLKFIFAPVRYLKNTIKEPSILQIFVSLTYIFLVSLFVITAIIDLNK